MEIKSKAKKKYKIDPAKTEFVKENIWTIVALLTVVPSATITLIFPKIALAYFLFMILLICAHFIAVKLKTDLWIPREARKNRKYLPFSVEECKNMDIKNVREYEQTIRKALTYGDGMTVGISTDQIAKIDAFYKEHLTEEENRHLYSEFVGLPFRCTPKETWESRNLIFGFAKEKEK